MNDKRINLSTITGRINAKALDLLDKNPEGLRWVDLSSKIKESDASFHPKTVNGCVWLLAEKFPDKVYKPSKGLFRLVNIDLGLSMNDQLLKWDIYEIESAGSLLNGVSLRGRIRKFGLEKSINLLVENTQDTENGVRFAVLSDSDAQLVLKYIKKIIPNVTIKLVMKTVPNPVLSKLRTNNPDRYDL